MVDKIGGVVQGRVGDWEGVRKSDVHTTELHQNTEGYPGFGAKDCIEPVDQSEVLRHHHKKNCMSEFGNK